MKPRARSDPQPEKALDKRELAALLGGWRAGIDHAFSMGLSKEQLVAEISQEVRCSACKPGELLRHDNFLWALPKYLELLDEERRKAGALKTTTA